MNNFTPPYNNPDYLAGFEQGKKHRESSPQTLKRLDDIDTELKKLTDLHGDLKVVIERLTNLVDKTEKQEEKVEKLHDRITTLEASQSSLMAKVGAIATVISTIVFAGLNKLF